MKRLTRVELRRLMARRLTRFALLAAVIAAGLILFGVHSDSKPPSAQEQRDSRVAYEQALKDFEANGAQQVADCKEQETREQAANPQADFGCDTLAPVPANFGKTPAKFADQWPSLVTGAAYLLMFLTFLVGAGFVAAEFSTGSVGTWLTFEPRRGRVYTSKMLAVALGSLPVVAVLMALLLGGSYVIVARNGSADLSGAQWSQLLATSGRATLLSSLSGVAGAAIGVLVRHTAAVLGIVMGYLIIAENILAGLVPSFQPWMARLNVNGWIEHGTRYFVEQCGNGPDGVYSCEGVQRTLTFTHASLYLGIGLAVLLVAAAMVFRRRDVG